MAVGDWRGDLWRGDGVAEWLRDEDDNSESDTGAPSSSINSSRASWRAFLRVADGGVVGAFRLGLT